eukprot:CAMPEP_0119521102 /NCGR_PEP_ID=MMETSP1344-20130328/36918_1 /TAXON_ID=236787 /ORGANISM="Florenciella parvula, Strain CCMP2471" /LENGTH=105 /DNA_ID=CAMNT_0007559047 /DNA_START=73 /DNA_END=390 /DNA_ORIENTATION=-
MSCERPWKSMYSFRSKPGNDVTFGAPVLSPRGVIPLLQRPAMSCVSVMYFSCERGFKICSTRRPWSAGASQCGFPERGRCLSTFSDMAARRNSDAGWSGDKVVFW